MVGQPTANGMLANLEADDATALANNMAYRDIFESRHKPMASENYPLLP